MFHSLWMGSDVIYPMAIAVSGDPDNGGFGWPEDEELEKARQAFPLAKTPEEKLTLAKKVQERLWAIGASGHVGQYFVPVAYRKNVTGLIRSPVQFFWKPSVSLPQVGRASCRERVCQYVSISVVRVPLNNKH